MADKVKEVAQTPPPPQLSIDDNRRRTRSQTRNGGMTPPMPAPVPEPRGRKRASQSQPNSGGKRGREAAKTTTATTKPVETVSSQATKETEVHSKQAEKQDLSKQKPTETTISKPINEKNKEDIDMESAEKVKSHNTGEEKKKSGKKQEAQKKAPEEAAGSLDTCKVKKAEPKQEPDSNLKPEKETKSELEPEQKPAPEPEIETKGSPKIDTAEVQEKKELVGSTKTSVENSCALPKKPEPEATGEAKTKSTSEGNEGKTLK